MYVDMCLPYIVSNKHGIVYLMSSTFLVAILVYARLSSMVYIYIWIILALWLSIIFAIKGAVAPYGKPLVTKSFDSKWLLREQRIEFLPYERGNSICEKVKSSFDAKVEFVFLI